MSRTDGVYPIPVDEVWGMFDQAMTYVEMRKIQLDFSPNRQGRATLWFRVAVPTQDVMGKPELGPVRRLGIRSSEREAILATHHDIRGPLGVQTEYHTGHMTLSVEIRNSLGNIDSSLECFYQALSIYEVAYGQSHQDIGNVLINIGNAYMVSLLLTL